MYPARPLTINFQSGPGLSKRSTDTRRLGITGSIWATICLLPRAGPVSTMIFFQWYVSINLAYTGISIILATSQAPGNKILSRCLLLSPGMPNFADGYAGNVPFYLSFTLRSLTAGTIRHETGSQASELANYRLYCRAVAVRIKHYFLRPKSAPWQQQSASHLYLRNSGGRTRGDLTWNQLN